MGFNGQEFSLQWALTNELDTTKVLQLANTLGSTVEQSSILHCGASADMQSRLNRLLSTRVINSLAIKNAVEINNILACMDHAICTIAQSQLELLETYKDLPKNPIETTYKETLLNEYPDIHMTLGSIRRIVLSSQNKLPEPIFKKMCACTRYDYIYMILTDGDCREQLLYTILLDLQGVVQLYDCIQNKSFQIQSKLNHVPAFVTLIAAQFIFISLVLHFLNSK